MRTHGDEVHEIGKGDDPEVLGVDYVATVELGKGPALDTWVSEYSIKPTKSPSDNKMHKANIAWGTILSAEGLINHPCPSGPGGDRSSAPGNSRLSI